VGVPVDGPHEFVFYAKRHDEFTKSAEFIERTRKFVEEKDITGFKMRGEARQNEERRRIQIGVELNDQSPGKITMFDESRQRILKKAHFETASGVFHVGKLPVSVKRTQRFAPPPPLGKTGKCIESRETSVRVGKSLKPPG
jgi:hypothetical protein